MVLTLIKWKGKTKQVQNTRTHNTLHTVYSNSLRRFWFISKTFIEICYKLVQFQNCKLPQRNVCLREVHFLVPIGRLGSYQFMWNFADLVESTWFFCLIKKSDRGDIVEVKAPNMETLQVKLTFSMRSRHSPLSTQSISAHSSPSLRIELTNLDYLRMVARQLATTKLATTGSQIAIGGDLAR